MDAVQVILSEIESVLSSVKTEWIHDMALKLHRHQGRIFLVGEGRSGLMAKAFAMRLMHLGASVFVVGETITPPIENADMVIAISGSGTTSGVVDKANKAHQMACFVMSITTDPDSPLAKVSDMLLPIQAATKYRTAGEAASVQPLGSLFDQTVHLALDAVCLEFASIRHQSNESAVKRHSNLE